MSLAAQWKDALLGAKNTTELTELKARLLGKTGLLSEQLRLLGKLTPEERKMKGEALNKEKELILSYIQETEGALEEKKWAEQLQKERVDISLPASSSVGYIHPISQVMEDVVSIFQHLGFSMAMGPNIETEYYNFDALNTPAHHPARASHDTFYLAPGTLLRTHTSGMQIRTLEKEKPPLRFISPGRVYRADYDRTHVPMFHQLEGLALEQGLTLGHLKGTLEYFLRQFFGDGISCRFRPSFFPFTEPSMEVDISFGGKEEWIEILGSGMVHPNVLCASPWYEKNLRNLQGFAFGMGLERLAMIKYGISDVRLLFVNNQPWCRYYVS